jgi:hypothetical protein
MNSLSLQRVRNQICDIVRSACNDLDECEKNLSHSLVKDEIRKARKQLLAISATAKTIPVGLDEGEHLIGCLRWAIAVARDVGLGIEESQLRRSLHNALRTQRLITQLPDRTPGLTGSLNTILTQRQQLRIDEPRLTLLNA